MFEPSAISVHQQKSPIAPGSGIQISQDGLDVDAGQIQSKVKVILMTQTTFRKNAY